MGSIPTRSRQLAWAVLCLAATISAPLSAQRIRGTVTLPDSAVAPAVLVVAADSTGALVARAVADARGAFDLLLPRAGRFELRALRVGFRPTVLPAVSVERGAIVPVRILLGEERARLDAIVVRRDDACGARDASDARVADVWEEARKALLLTKGGYAGTGMIADWRLFERRLDETGTRVLAKDESRSRGPSDRPFVSRPAGSLAHTGYVIETADGAIYFAPDADVLLSETFARAHCFDLVERVEAGESRIGLRFRPLLHSARHDIEGTLWLARQSAALRHLEFSYTGMSDIAAPAAAGGRVEFARIADGTFVIRRWWIRMPDIVRVQSEKRIGSQLAVSASPTMLRGIRIGGGEVTRLERDGAVVLHSDDVGADAEALGLGAGGEVAAEPVPAVEVVVRTTDVRGLALANVQLRLLDAAGQRHLHLTDSAGLARLRDLPAGRLQIEAQRDDLMPVRGDVDLVPGVTDATLSLDPDSTGTVVSSVRARVDASARARFAEYDARRKRRASMTITREEILRMDVGATWQLLRSVRGMRLIELPTGIFPALGRQVTRRAAMVRTCYLRLAIDGVLLEDDPVDLRHRLPPAEEIHGIELFVGPASRPPELQGDRRPLPCGVILVWKR